VVFTRVDTDDDALARSDVFGRTSCAPHRTRTLGTTNSRHPARFQQARTYELSADCLNRTASGADTAGPLSPCPSVSPVGEA